jgi:serine/threonine protein kinase
MEEFEQLRVIGRGNYGVATLCREKSTGELVVVKTIGENKGFSSP